MVADGLAIVEPGKGQQVHQVRLTYGSDMLALAPNRASRSSLRTTFVEEIRDQAGDVVATVTQHKQINPLDRWAYVLSVTDNLVTA